MEVRNSSVLDRLSRRDAFSDSRRSYLETFANLLVRTEVDVKFAALDNPAACRPRQDEDGFEVLIDKTTFQDRCTAANVTTSEVLSGPLSNVSDGYVDAFLQEGLLYHELGHVLFSDFEAINDVVRQVPTYQRQHLHDYLNVFEDAVIEVFLRQMFDCGTQLLVKNRVFHEMYHADQPMWDKPWSVEPTMLATLPGYELGRYDTGVLEKFEDISDNATDYAKEQKEAVDAGIECFYDVIQLPDPHERYERILQLFNSVGTRSPGADTQSEMDDVTDPEPGNDFNRQDGQQMPAPDIDLDESDEEESEEGEAGGSSSVSEDEEEEEESSESGSESTEGDSDADPEPDESEEDTSPESLVGELDEEDIKDLEADTDVSPDDESQERASDIESEFEAIGAGANQNRSVEVADADSFDADPTRVRTAERRSHSLERVVRKKFRPRKGSAENTGLTSGRFDSREMINASRGSPRVFKKEEDPDEPDFQVVVAVDESGSMNAHDRVENATSAATTVTKAFEDAGGQSWVVRFGRRVRVVKTPSMRYDESKDAIAEASTNGSTNLFPLLEEYDDITEQARNSFLLIISDGRPANGNGCMEKIKSLDDPTAVLQISRDGYDGWQEAADAFAVVGDDEMNELPKKTEALVRRLVETRGTAI